MVASTDGTGLMDSATGLYLDSNDSGNVYADAPNGGDFQNWVEG
jgi:hypothetical protein